MHYTKVLPKKFFHKKQRSPPTGYRRWSLFFMMTISLTLINLRNYRNQPQQVTHRLNKIGLRWYILIDTFSSE